MRIALFILPLTYTPPSEEVKQRAAQIERLVQRYFGAEYDQSGQPQFAFLEQFSTGATTPLPPRRDDGLRFILRTSVGDATPCATTTDGPPLDLSQRRDLYARNGYPIDSTDPKM